jgi:LysM repeat protein
VRILLWILLLLCVFGAVSLYHARFAETARDERGAAHAAAEAGRPLPSGYGARVIVGEKSGAPVVEGLPPAEPPNAVPADPKAQPAPAPKPSPTAATTHVVKRGESLSTICDKYYGTSKKEYVEALAKVNKLKSVSAIREGQTLTIPPLDKLGVAAK